MAQWIVMIAIVVFTPVLRKFVTMVLIKIVMEKIVTKE